MKRKGRGDLEFENQVAMALLASAGTAERKSILPDKEEETANSSTRNKRSLALKALRRNQESGSAWDKKALSSQARITSVTRRSRQDASTELIRS